MSLTGSTTEPTIIGIAKDAANLCTLAGVLSGTIGVLLAARGSIAAALIAGVVAVLLDCFDGPIARRTKNRARRMSELGLQLDSLADAICSGVGPAVIVLAVADFHPAALVPAAALVIAGVMRLAYFNVYGLSGGSFSGLPIFYSPVLIALIWLVTIPLPATLEPWTLGIGAIAIAALNIASIKVPKLRGKFFPIFIVLCFVLIGILAIGILQGSGI